MKKLAKNDEILSDEIRFSDAGLYERLLMFVEKFFFLYLLKDGDSSNAPSWLKENRAIVLKFVGVSSLQSEQGKKAAKEKIADQFVSYILTGKAPSSQLKRVLVTFLEWSKLFYRKNKASMSFDEQVDELFSRLDKVEASVFSKSVVEGYFCCLPVKSGNGLRKNDFARLDDLAHKGKQLAQELLTIDVVQVFQPTVQAVLISDEEEFYQDSKKALAESALYKAVDAIKQNLTVDAWQLAQECLLREESLLEGAEFKSSFVDEVWQELDYVAELYDFSSGSELAQKILSVLPLEVMSYELARRAVRQKYDKVYSDEEVFAQRSIEVLYNGYSSRLAANELRVIGKTMGQEVVADKVHKDQLEKVKSDIKELSVSDVVDIKKYIAAERRAWEKCLVAWSEDDLEEAYRQKQIQLYNDLLVQEGLVARERYEAARAFLLEKGLQDTAWSDVRNYVQVADILDRFGFVSFGYREDEKVEGLFDYVSRQERENPALLAIASWLQDDEEYLETEESLTLSEYEDVANAIRNIERIDQIGLSGNGLAVLANGGCKSSLVDRLVSEASSCGQLPDAELVKEVRLGNKSIVELVGVLGKVWQEVFVGSVQRAADHEARLLSKVYSALDKAFSDAGFDEKRRAQDVSDKVFVSEWGASLSRSELRVIALNLGSEENVACLLSELEKRFGEGDWSEKNVKYVLANYLNRQDFELVSKIWRVLDLTSDFSKMSKHMAGFYTSKESPPTVEFVVSDGSFVSVSGGYYPLRENVFVANQKGEIAQNYFGVLPYEDVLTKVVSSDAFGIEWDFTAVFKHVEQLVHDIAFRAVMHDLNGIVHDEKVQKVLLEKLGYEGLVTLVVWQQAVSGNKSEIRKVLCADAISELLASKRLLTSSIFKQLAVVPSDVSDLAVLKKMAGDYLPIKLLGEVRAKELEEFVSQKSVVLKEKITKLSLDKESFVISRVLDSKQVEKFLLWSELFLEVPVWLSVYEKEVKNGKTEAKAVGLADNAVMSLIKGDDNDRLHAMEVCLDMFVEFFAKYASGWQQENSVMLSKAEYEYMADFMAKQFVGFGVANAFVGSLIIGQEFFSHVTSWFCGIASNVSIAKRIGLVKMLGFTEVLPVMTNLQKGSLQVKDVSKMSLWFGSVYRSLVWR